MHMYDTSCSHFFLMMYKFHKNNKLNIIIPKYSKKLRIKNGYKKYFFNKFLSFFPLASL